MLRLNKMTMNLCQQYIMLCQRKGKASLPAFLCQIRAVSSLRRHRFTSSRFMPRVRPSTVT